MQHRAVLPLQPLPIAQLVQAEVVGIEQIHRPLGAEAIGDDGDAVEAEGAEAPFEFERLTGAVRGDEVKESAAHAPRADDEVDLAARTGLHLVDGLLDGELGEVPHLRLDVGLHPAVTLARHAIEVPLAEDGAQPRDFEALGVLQVDAVSRGRGDGAAREGDGALVAVDGDHGAARCGGAARVVDVHDHALGKVAHGVHRVDGTLGGGDLPEQAGAVAEEHSAEVIGGALHEPVHLVVEQVDKGPLGILGGADGLIRDLDVAEQIFEGRDELRIGVARRGGQGARFRARADAAVDAIADELAHVLAPHVRGRFLDLGEQGVGGLVELVAHRFEVIRFEYVVCCLRCDHWIIFLLSDDGF